MWSNRFVKVNICTWTLHLSNLHLFQIRMCCRLISLTINCQIKELPSSSSSLEQGGGGGGREVISYVLRSRNIFFSLNEFFLMLIIVFLLFLAYHHWTLVHTFDCNQDRLGRATDKHTSVCVISLSLRLSRSFLSEPIDLFDCCCFFAISCHILHFNILVWR